MIIYYILDSIECHDYVGTRWKSAAASLQL